MRAQFITAEEVQQVLDVSRSKSYQIIRELNKELKSMGYHTIAGKCPIQFFKQKFYGLEIGGESALSTKNKTRPFRFHLLAQMGNSRFPM